MSISTSSPEREHQSQYPDFLTGESAAAKMKGNSLVRIERIDRFMSSY